MGKRESLSELYVLERTFCRMRSSIGVWEVEVDMLAKDQCSPRRTSGRIIENLAASKEEKTSVRW